MKDIEEVKRRLSDAETKLKGKGWYFEDGSISQRIRVRLFTHLRHPFDPLKFHRHSEDGEPAVDERYCETNVSIRQEWRSFGELHRENGPARILRDPMTGVVVRQDWFINGHHHRVDGPAVTIHDRVTGATTYEAYWEKGKKLSELSHPENDSHPTPRMLAARNRRKPQQAIAQPPAPH